MPGTHEAPKKRERAGSVRGSSSSRIRTEEYDYEAEYDRPERRMPPPKTPGWLVPAVTALCVVLVLLLACGGFVLYVAGLDTVYPNVRLEGIDVGGLGTTAALIKMDEEAPEGYEGKSVTVELPMDEALTVAAADIGLGGTRSSAVEAAYGYGREGNALENALCYLRCLWGRGADILWEGTGVDEAALQALAEAEAATLNEKLDSADVEIGDKTIVLIKGAGHAHADPAALCELVTTAFRTRDFSTLSYEPAMDGGDGIDLQALYEKIYVEPENAGYDKENQCVTDSVTGVSFDMEKAQRLVDRAKAGDEVTIELVLTEPDITSDALRENLFRDCLASKTTSLSGSSSSRINNVTLSSQSINDTVLLPGEEFSYNQCLGERTAAAGYQEAGVYANGKHTTGLGGGICQASSMLYYCSLKANLEITERWEHYFAVSYLPMGMDATVSWGGPDYCFRNSRDFPIKIVSWVDGYDLHVEIWGTDVDGSYVDITSDGWEDATYYYAQTYRNVYAADGSLISSVPEAYSSYNKYEAEDEE